MPWGQGTATKTTYQSAMQQLFGEQDDPLPRGTLPLTLDSVDLEMLVASLQAMAPDTVAVRAAWKDQRLRKRPVTEIVAFAPAAGPAEVRLRVAADRLMAGMSLDDLLTRALALADTYATADVNVAVPDGSDLRLRPLVTLSATTPLTPTVEPYTGDERRIGHRSHTPTPVELDTPVRSRRVGRRRTHRVSATVVNASTTGLLVATPEGIAVQPGGTLRVRCGEHDGWMVVHRTELDAGGGHRYGGELLRPTPPLLRALLEPADGPAVIPGTAAAPTPTEPRAERPRVERLPQREPHSGVEGRLAG